MLIIFSIITIAYFCYLIYLNIKFKRIIKHDKAMFQMAQLRRDAFKYLRTKHEVISKEDATNLLNLIGMMSFIISNHDEFYNTEFSYSSLKNSIKLSIKELKEAEPIVNTIKNKTIKAFYDRYSSTLIYNIKSHIPFFYLKVFVVIIDILIFMKLKKHLNLIKAQIDWLLAKDKIVEPIRA